MSSSDLSEELSEELMEKVNKATNEIFGCTVKKCVENELESKYFPTVFINLIILFLMSSASDPEKGIDHLSDEIKRYLKKNSEEVKRAISERNEKIDEKKEMDEKKESTVH